MAISPARTSNHVDDIAVAIGADNRIAKIILKGAGADPEVNGPELASGPASMRACSIEVLWAKYPVGVPVAARASLNHAVASGVDDALVVAVC